MKEGSIFVGFFCSNWLTIGMTNDLLKELPRELVTWIDISLSELNVPYYLEQEIHVLRSKIRRAQSELVVQEKD